MLKLFAHITEEDKMTNEGGKVFCFWAITLALILFYAAGAVPD